MARVDSTGITPTDIAGYRERFQTSFRDSFGQNMAFDDETPQSQWIGIAALALAEVDEILVADANGLAPSGAAGFNWTTCLPG